MERSSVFLITGIIIFAVGAAWIISGGITGPAAESGKLIPVTTGATVPMTAASIPTPPRTTVPLGITPTVTNGVPPVTTTTMFWSPATPPVTATMTAVSGDDVKNHFLDIAYTSTNRVERLDFSSSRPRVVVSASSASDDDIAVLEKTIKSFNDASRTVKLSENVKNTDSGDILIKFLPEDGLKAIDLNTAADTGPFSDVLTRRELFQGNVIGAKVLRGTVYVNGNLKGDAKKHMLVRSLMYELGLTGETTKYPDSVFYAGENTNVELSSIDKKAIAMLYESQFYNGMNAEGLRYVIYSP